MSGFRASSVRGMRLGVLDVGSNTLHLLVVDAHQGARPIPAFSHKAELHLGEHLDNGNRLTAAHERELRSFVDEALRLAEDKGVQEMMGFATSAVRDAVNGEEILARIEAQTEVSIQVLPGPDEARLTFLAARRWFGWSSGRLLMLDIGGGSLEIAAGQDEDPTVAISLPLGAGRLTREWLPGDPPAAGRCAAAAQARPGRDRRHGGAVLRDGRPTTRWPPRRRSGSWPGSPAPRRPVRAPTSGARLRHADADRAGRGAGPTPVAERASCRGCPRAGHRSWPPGPSSPTRPWTCSSLPELEICPWALREGVILRRLDMLAGVGVPSAPGSTLP